MVKIALIGIVGILLALQIKAVKPEYAVYLCMGVSLLIFMVVCNLYIILKIGVRLIKSTVILHRNVKKIKRLFLVSTICI